MPRLRLCLRQTLPHLLRPVKRYAPVVPLATSAVQASGGTGTVSYQWYSNTSNSTSGGSSLGSANGAQTSTYSPPATSTVGTTYYYIQMTATGSGCNTATSPATASVAVVAQPSLTNPTPASQTVCNNATIAGISRYIKQWHRHYIIPMVFQQQ